MLSKQLIIFSREIQDSNESPRTPVLRKLFEGDVKLNGKQKLIKSGIVKIKPSTGNEPGQAATNDDSIKWPNAVIPYEFDCSVGKMSISSICLCY